MPTKRQIGRTARIKSLRQFLQAKRPAAYGDLTAVSLFSGAGLSDLGYKLAGFRFLVQVEKDKVRAEIGQANFRESQWMVGDVRRSLRRAVKILEEEGRKSIDLLVATPPCQGMSSSNPSRGKRATRKAATNESKNKLILQVARWARALNPRVIVAENVRQILTLPVGTRKKCALDLLKRRLPQYSIFSSVVNVADYGVPQDRRRAVIVAVRNDEPWLGELNSERCPWPAPTHARKATKCRKRWIGLGEWLRAIGYERLDSRNVESAMGKDQLHFVPHYDDDRYLLVKSIPPNSGRNAYENDVCPSCGKKKIRDGLVRCPRCRQVLRNRPIVRNGRSVRLIDGFHSSYRRMAPGVPASTITTNSSHIGSDNKIHPWEHRVLSILECADLQTVPRFFDWSLALERHRSYLIRNLIGEAFPPYFTYLHGKMLHDLLTRKSTAKRLRRAA